jgi:hypothetical protein
MTRQFFNDIKAQLLTLQSGGAPVLKMISRWNNQVELLYAEDGSKNPMFLFPACFISFKASEIMQLAQGVQLYENLIVDLHILDWQIDAGDGTMEQDLGIYDLKEQIYSVMNKFKVNSAGDSAGTFMRIAEEDDDKHYGVYHFVQRYKTSFVDNSLQEPVSGIPSTVPMPVEADVKVNASGDTAEPYIRTNPGT